MTVRTWLLRCYPPEWRKRYGDDLTAYLDDTYAGRMPVGAAVSLIVGGIRERTRAATLGDATTTAGVRVRAGVLMVLAGWAAFALAGSGFAKVSEHFDSSLPTGAHGTADVAYAAVQVVATLTSLAVIAGFLLAVPALLRFLSSGGWPLIRRHVARAAVATAVTAGMTIAVVGWAHHLTAAQRNGGDASYSALFLVWGGLVSVTTTMWTVAIVVTARRLAMSRALLLAEAALASVVTTGMLVIVVAAAVWWAAVASSAPSFFGGAPVGLGSGWNPQLAGTFTLMAAALVWAAVGVARIARSAHAVVQTDAS